MLLGALDFLPIGPDLVHILDLQISKHMRMAANQFIGDVAGHFFKIKRASLAGKLAMKDDLKQKVPEFLGHFVVVAGFDGIEQFIDLLDCVPAQREMVLFAVPGAAAG